MRLTAKKVRILLRIEKRAMAKKRGRRMANGTILTPSLSAFSLLYIVGLSCSFFPFLCLHAQSSLACLLPAWAGNPPPLAVRRFLLLLLSRESPRRRRVDLPAFFLLFCLRKIAVASYEEERREEKTVCYSSLLHAFRESEKS